MIGIREINRSKHDILVRSRVKLIVKSFTQSDLDVCSPVRHQMRIFGVLAGPSVQHELERLAVSSARTAAACWDNVDLGGADSVLSEKRLVLLVTDSGGNVELQSRGRLDQSEALTRCGIEDEDFLISCQ